MFNTVIFSEIRAVCGIMWTNTVEPDRPQMKMRRMLFACRVTKAADTHSMKYVLLLIGNNGYSNALQCDVT